MINSALIVFSKSPTKKSYNCKGLQGEHMGQVKMDSCHQTNLLLPLLFPVILYSIILGMNICDLLRFVQLIN